jgi:hypothetical protein
VFLHSVRCFSHAGYTVNTSSNALELQVRKKSTLYLLSYTTNTQGLKRAGMHAEDVQVAQQTTNNKQQTTNNKQSTC